MITSDPDKSKGRTFPAGRVTKNIASGASSIQAENFSLGIVTLDPRAGYEYAKVRHLYDQFGLGDRTQIEYFNGGHAMHNSQTFEFLHKYLHWP